MRRVIKPKIIYKYTGDDSTEAKEEAERVLESIFFPIFDKLAKENRQRKDKARKSR